MKNTKQHLNNQHVLFEIICDYTFKAVGIIIVIISFIVLVFETIKINLIIL